jgi:hypothetical protein
MAAILMRHVSRTMPGARGQWAVAMANEMQVIVKDGEAFRWALGCLLTCYIEKIKSALGGFMNRQKINHISAIVPIVMSSLALLTVLAVITTGWERNLKDEGAAAHIFQILVVAQIPFTLAFLVTANWKQGMLVVRPLAFQFLPIGIAFGLVAFFRL